MNGVETRPYRGNCKRCRGLVHGRIDKEYCCKECRQLTYWEGPRHAAKTKAYRSAVLGRVCATCKRDDSQLTFMGPELCVTCYGKRRR